eukprot:SAG31_NODE_3466_length_4242_cov_9.396573_4_plen_216_part_00
MIEIHIQRRNTVQFPPGSIVPAKPNRARARRLQLPTSSFRICRTRRDAGDELNAAACCPHEAPHGPRRLRADGRRRGPLDAALGARAVFGCSGRRLTVGAKAGAEPRSVRSVAQMPAGRVSRSRHHRDRALRQLHPRVRPSMGAAAAAETVRSRSATGHLSAGNPLNPGDPLNGQPQPKRYLNSYSPPVAAANERSVVRGEAPSSQQRVRSSETF